MSPGKPKPCSVSLPCEWGRCRSHQPDRKAPGEAASLIYLDYGQASSRRRWLPRGCPGDVEGPGIDRQRWFRLLVSLFVSPIQFLRIVRADESQSAPSKAIVRRKLSPRRSPLGSSMEVSGDESALTMISGPTPQGSPMVIAKRGFAVWCEVSTVVVPQTLPCFSRCSVQALLSRHPS